MPPTQSSYIRINVGGGAYVPFARLVRVFTHPNSAIREYALHQVLQVPARYPGRHRPLFVVTNPLGEGYRQQLHLPRSRQ